MGLPMVPPPLTLLLSLHQGLPCRSPPAHRPLFLLLTLTTTMLLLMMLRTPRPHWRPHVPSPRPLFPLLLLQPLTMRLLPLLTMTMTRPPR